jgi:PKD repeat protein
MKVKKNIVVFLTIVLFLLLTGCGTTSKNSGSGESGGAGSQAIPMVKKVDFSAAPTTGYTPLVVQFIDNSLITQNIVEKLWDFGDGTTVEASNPSHTYTADGTYTVSLKITYLDGVDVKIKNEEKPNLINVGVQPIIADTIPNGTVRVFSNLNAYVSEYSGVDSIENAIADCGDGYKVRLGPGTHQVDTLIAIHKDIQMTPANNGNSANVIIDGNNSTRIFEVAAGKNLLIKNITIQKGNFQGVIGAFSVKGILNMYDCQIKNCLGFAMYVSGIANLTDCIFSNNGVLPNSTGALYIDSGVVTGKNIYFKDNKGTSASGIFINSGKYTGNNNSFLNGNGSCLNISGTGQFNGANNIFRDNLKTAVLINPSAKFIANNSRFINNQNSGSTGGAIDNWGIFVGHNNIFSSNSANSGAAIYNRGTFTGHNNAFVFNSASAIGGAVYNEGSFAAKNSIYFRNSAAMDESGHNIYNNAGTIGAIYSCFYDINNNAGCANFTITHGFNGNLISNPKFELSSIPTHEYTLQTGISPCIDTGSLSGTTASDIDGNPRSQGAGVDMGAKEQ